MNLYSYCSGSRKQFNIKNNRVCIHFLFLLFAFSLNLKCLLLKTGPTRVNRKTYVSSISRMREWYFNIQVTNSDPQFQSTEFMTYSLTNISVPNTKVVKICFYNNLKCMSLELDLAYCACMQQLKSHLNGRCHYDNILKLVFDYTCIQDTVDSNEPELKDINAA